MLISESERRAMSQFDPLHLPGGPTTYWTTINAEENLPGVVTPLSSSFWLRPVSVGTLGAFVDLGVLKESEARYSDDVDERICSVMFGRFCANVDLLRACVDRMPGTDGNALEEQLFSNVREGIPTNNSIARYPIVAAKAPRAAATIAGRIHRGFAASQAWWRASIDAVGNDDAQRARWRLQQAHDHMAAMMRPHTLGTFLTQGVFDQLGALAESAGRPGFALELSSGVGSLEETEMLARLWDVAHGRSQLDAFLQVYGFHGPGEAAASSTVWRENPGALAPLVERYRTMSDERSPAAVARRVLAARTSAAADLLASLPAFKRPSARLLLKLTNVYWPLRETGKATLLHAIDVGRAAARRLGGLMVAAGSLEDPSDSAYLTVAELVAHRSADWREEVTFRRARREEYLTQALPQTWEGVPTPIAITTLGADGGAVPRPTELVGLGGSAGTAEGRVRIVSDPFETDLDDGEVLVCVTTDPSWAALFLVAAAVVIDVGGPMSHGAIVSRELGLPCVINTRTGTRELRDRDLVRVDGNAGRVEVLEPAADQPLVNPTA
jgi:phosphohistidine swiveling domain-containing protein